MVYTYVKDDPTDRTDPTGLWGLGVAVEDFIAGTSGGGDMKSSGVGFSYHDGVLEVGGFYSHGTPQLGAGGGAGLAGVIIPKSLSGMAGPSKTITGSNETGGVSVSNSVHSDGHGGETTAHTPNSVTVAIPGLSGGGGAAEGTTTTDVKVVARVNVGAIVSAAKQAAAGVQHAASVVNGAVQAVQSVLKPPATQLTPF